MNNICERHYWFIAGSCPYCVPDISSELAVKRDELAQSLFSTPRCSFEFGIDPVKAQQRVNDLFEIRRESFKEGFNACFNIMKGQK